MARFTPLETRLLRQLMTSKPDEEIALVLDRPVEEVRTQIRELTGGISPYNQRQVDKEAVRQNRKARAATACRLQQVNEELTRQQERRLSRQRDQEAAQKRKQREQPQYETRAVDLSQLREVRIDAKTCIYIRPGQDPVAEKKNYLARLQGSRSTAKAREVVQKEVKKFKPIK